MNSNKPYSSSHKGTPPPPTADNAQPVGEHISTGAPTPSSPTAPRSSVPTTENNTPSPTTSVPHVIADGPASRPTHIHFSAPLNAPPVGETFTQRFTQRVQKFISIITGFTLLVLTFLLIIFISQNLESVPIHLLNFEANAPLALALGTATILGAAITSLIASWLFWKKYHSRAQKNNITRAKKRSLKKKNTA